MRDLALPVASTLPPWPNVLELTGDGGEADGVRCSDGLGGRRKRNDVDPFVIDLPCFIHGNPN